MKTVCIYHECDLDGWMSAAIVKYWFIENNEFWTIKDHSKTEFNTCTNRGLIGIENPHLDFIGYNYGQPIPDLSEYDKVIMCDISFPKEEMDKLLDRFDYSLVWIDHHISAIKDNFEEDDDYEYTKFIGLRNTNFAACELTWKYFFPNETMPEIVRLLGRYDCFGHKGTDEETKVLEFQYGARTIISNYEEAYKELIECLTYLPEAGYPSREGEILGMGKAVYSFLCTEAKQVYKNRFEVWFDDAVQTSAGNSYKFICINKERFNPINFGIEYHKDGYDGAACFYFDGTNYNFSLYNDNGNVDCSIIAKQYGGGGHKGAAGFRLTLEQFNRLIKG